ncbi:J domain-containing protein [Aquabacterium sp.]|uniref:J domain-containing protein n=1 Tax=Aquabacterium sp. TaxID=1872578 RepID=UPI0024888628|nr:J domain-containing protein [Aquabacterium sp.]MDI1259222.1 J domain-containing protein [Aquabacterium sp.]
MKPQQTLQIIATSASALLSPEQKRFNKLTEQIDKARAKLAAWHANLPPFLSVRQERVLPLARTLQATQVGWIRAVDLLLDEKGWKKAERSTLQDVLCEAIDAVIGQLDEDEAQEMRTLYDKHADHLFEDAQAEDRQAFIDMVQDIAGIDLGDDAQDQPEEELMARMQEKLAARAAEAEAMGHGAQPQAKLSKAQAKKQAEAELTNQSLREIYRKLASALHPDREPDADKREAKTALMQRANQAYANKDLMALLSLQMETAQIDANSMASTAPARLKLYNKALAEQLADIQFETRRLEEGLRMDLGLPPRLPLHPDKLIKVVDFQVAQLSHAQMDFERDLLTFKDRAATKRWIKREQERFGIDALSNDWF